LSDSVSLCGPPPTGALLPGAPPAPAPASAPLALPRPTGAAATNVGATEPAPPAERSSEVARRAPEAAAPRGLYGTRRSDKRGGLGGGVLPEASAYLTRHACNRRTSSSTPSSLRAASPPGAGADQSAPSLKGLEPPRRPQWRRRHPGRRRTWPALPRPHRWSLPTQAATRIRRQSWAARPPGTSPLQCRRLLSRTAAEMPLPPREAPPRPCHRP